MSVFFYKPKPLFAALSLAIILALSPSALYAAEETAGSPALTAATLLEKIREKGGIYFAEAGADLAAAHARLERARANLYPSASLTYEAERYNSALASEKDRVEIFGGIEIVQRIYDFGGTGNQIDAARADEGAAKLRYEDARNTVLMEGLALYFNLQTSDITVQTLDQAHASAYVRWDRAKARLKLGTRSTIDVAKRLAKVEKTRLKLHREQRRNADLRLRLTDLSGLPFDEEMYNAPKGPAKRPPAIDTEHVQKRVIETNRLLQSIAKNLDALRHASDAARNLPWVEAFGKVNHYSRNTRGRDEWTGGARLKWSFLDGGAASSERARIKAEIRRAEARMERTRRRLKRQSRTTLIDRKNAWQQLIAARAQFDFRTKSLLQRQRLYEQDRVADLGRAMIDFTQAEVEVARAAGNLQMVNARLAVLLGHGPEISLNENFIIDVLGTSAVDDESSNQTKEGSGFGQEDQNKINR